jgi:hypothetical protein
MISANDDFENDFVPPYVNKSGIYVGTLVNPEIELYNGNPTFKTNFLLDDGRAVNFLTIYIIDKDGKPNKKNIGILSSLCFLLQSPPFDETYEQVLTGLGNKKIAVALAGKIKDDGFLKFYINRFFHPITMQTATELKGNKPAEQYKQVKEYLDSLQSACPSGKTQQNKPTGDGCPF